MSVEIKEIARRSKFGLDPRVRRYMDRLVSPLLGPIRRLTVFNYDASSPALFTILPDLADIHRRAGIPTTPQYHVGGFGFFREEAIMRALGESMERLAHVTFHISYPHLIRKHCQEDLESAGVRHLSIYELGRFSPEQRKQPRFPFRVVSGTTPISWVPAIDLRNGGDTLVPVQAVITGFMTSEEEPRTVPAMTTGTAAHVTYGQALLGALLELLQLDAAMGHWYSHSTAPRIEISSASTPRFARFMKIYSTWLDRANSWFEFYWLRRPDDIPVYVIACAFRRPRGFPAMSLGLGAAPNLERALYSALYETIPIASIAMMKGLEQLYGMQGEEPRRKAGDLHEAFRRIDPGAIMDLETAVSYYAMPEYAETLFPTRFDPHEVVTGPEIRRHVPPLDRNEAPDKLAEIILSETIKRYRLFALDLSTEDSIACGFRVVRLYSPDLLSLCFPSFPEATHPRYDAYGGFRSAAPHPYP